MRKRIFISSVQKEFAEDRAFLKRFIEGNPILNRFFNVFVFEEDVPAADRTTAEVFLSEIANSDIYLGLIGNQYGFEDSAGISPTEREFDEATRLGLERLILVKGHDDQKREPKEIAFLRKISPELIRRRYEGRDALLTEIYASLDHILAGDGAYHLLPFDARPCDHATLDDIDENKVRWFVSRAREERGFPLALGTSVSDILSHLKLLDRDSQRPLNAAILLFGKNPQDYHLSSEVKCAYWHGTERIKPISSYKVYRGTLFDMADQAVDFIMSKLDRRIGTRVHGTTAPATYEIPEPVISEIIINAIAHRQYDSTGSVQVELFSDRIDISNPGGLNPSIKKEQLTQIHSSYPNNPLIAEALYLARYIERMGTGLTDVVRQCQEVGLEIPEFIIRPQECRVLIRRPGEHPRTIIDESSQKSSQRRRQIISMLSNEPYMSAENIGLAIGISRRAVMKHIKILQNEGILRRIGPDKGGYWEVMNKNL